MATGARNRHTGLGGGEGGEGGPALPATPPSAPARGKRIVPPPLPPRRGGSSRRPPRCAWSITGVVVRDGEEEPRSAGPVAYPWGREEGRRLPACPVAPGHQCGVGERGCPPAPALSTAVRRWGTQPSLPACPALRATLDAGGSRSTESARVACFFKSCSTPIYVKYLASCFQTAFKILLNCGQQ